MQGKCLLQLVVVDKRSSAHAKYFRCLMSAAREPKSGLYASRLLFHCSRKHGETLFEACDKWIAIVLTVSSPQHLCHLLSL
jgi:hypothetical protein